MLKELILSSSLLLEGPLLAQEDISEVQCLTEAIWHEARGESTLEWASVATVIKNRVLSPKYPSTYCGVIRQKAQFSYLWDEHPDGVNPKDHTGRVVLRDVVLIATLVYKGLAEVGSITDTKALHYYNPTKADPKWARKGKVVDGLKELKHNYIVLD